jgi:hypothetical protein
VDALKDIAAKIFAARERMRQVQETHCLLGARGNAIEAELLSFDAKLRARTDAPTDEELDARARLKARLESCDALYNSTATLQAACENLDGALRSAEPFIKAVAQPSCVEEFLIPACSWLGSPGVPGPLNMPHPIEGATYDAVGNRKSMVDRESWPRALEDISRDVLRDIGVILVDRRPRQLAVEERFDSQGFPAMLKDALGRVIRRLTRKEALSGLVED